MTKRITKGSDGMYSVKGVKYPLLVGSKAQVAHGTAYKTSGGLTKSGIFFNKRGRYVSRKKHLQAKQDRRLQKHGWTAKKGKFGAVRLGKSISLNKTKKRTKSRRAKTAGRR